MAVASGLQPIPELRELRGDRSYRQLAEEIGVSFTAVRAWEFGASRPDAVNGAAYAESLGITVHRLLTILKRYEGGYRGEPAPADADALE